MRYFNFAHKLNLQLWMETRYSRGVNSVILLNLKLFFKCYLYSYSYSYRSWCERVLMHGSVSFHNSHPTGAE